MYIIVQNDLDNTFSYKLGKVTFDEQLVTVEIQGYSSVNMVGPGNQPQNSWINTIQIEAIHLPNTSNIRQAIAEYLTAEGRIYAGGELVTDEDYAFRVRQIDMLRRVKQKRGQLWVGTAPSSFVARVNISPESRDNIQGLLKMFEILERQGKPLPSIEFTMADDKDYTFTPAQFEQLAVDAGMYVYQVHRRKRELGVLIMAATTVEELDAIDVEAGWPE